MPKKFDVIIIGAGSALNISAAASSHGLKTAIVEKGPFGGTCFNRGCIPSKIFIHTADLAESIQNAGVFGINAKINSINWTAIQKRVWNGIDPHAKQMERANRNDKNITVYKTTGKFVGKKQLRVSKETITADKIFIMAGTRPVTPNIPGLDSVAFHTSDTIMRVKKQPKNLIIIGGGYIGVEMAQFFGSLGTKVTIIDRGDRLVKLEDEEVSKKFTKIFSKKATVVLGATVEKIGKSGRNITVAVIQKGKKKRITGDQLLLAIGRRPNSDILDVEKTGVTTNQRGYIITNDYLETNVKGIWAAGDIAGKYLFKHSANLEAQYAFHNAFNHKMKVDYTAMPHAIFSSPQIAGVGKTEQQLKHEKRKYAVGKYEYIHTGMGTALQDRDGFVKVLADHSGEILGCHILGTNASSIIHEVLVAMKAGLGVSGIKQTVHIHPALSEVVQRAFSNL